MPASSRRSAASATAEPVLGPRIARTRGTMPSPKPSTASTKPRGSARVVPGAVSKQSSLPPWNVWTGSTIGASSSRSAISLPPKPRRAIVPKSPVYPNRRSRHGRLTQTKSSPGNLARFTLRIRRVFMLIDPDAFEGGFPRWAQSLTDKVERTVVAIDGKPVRRSGSRHNHGPLHLVSAWASDQGLVLGQREVDGKSNETTAISDLLDTQGSRIRNQRLNVMHASATGVLTG